MKPIIYCGSARKDISSFSEKAKQRIARLLDMLAEGLEIPPENFKYISTIGTGVYELRVKTDKHYRVFYITKFEEAIYVLHAFVKKTPQTPQQELEKAKQRLKKILHGIKGNNHA